MARLTRRLPWFIARFTEFVLVDDESPFFCTPNRISTDQFDMWSGDRACGLFSGMESAYSAPLAMTTASHARVQPALVTAPVGKGRIVITTLCLAQQLEAAQLAAPKLLVNLLTRASTR